jgi:hypothetical protein
MSKNHHLKDTEHKPFNILLHISYFLRPHKSSDFRGGGGESTLELSDLCGFMSKINACNGKLKNIQFLD